MFAIIFNMELISIVLGLGAMALPVVCMARRGKPGPWAAGSFFLTTLAVTFQLFLLARFVEQDMATVEDTANARFLAAMVLLVCTAVLNLAAFLLARRRAHALWLRLRQRAGHARAQRRRRARGTLL